MYYLRRLRWSCDLLLSSFLKWIALSWLILQFRDIIFIAGHVSLGCFFNKKCSPLSYLYEKDGLTRDECVQHCKDNRYPYAGFDHCRKCFCSTNFMTYAQINSNDCKSKSKSRCKKIKRGCEASSHIELFRTSKSYSKTYMYIRNCVLTFLQSYFLYLQ